MYLANTFQNIEFQTMSQEGEDLWAAMGTVKTIDSLSWTQVRNDLTGRYQQETITNELGQQEIMETWVVTLMVNRTVAENERIQQFLAHSGVYSIESDTEA